MSIIIGQYAIETVLSFLNRHNWSQTLPQELDDVYTNGEFARHKLYRVANFKFELLDNLLGVIVLLLFLLLGGFPLVDGWVRYVSDNIVVQSLLFIGIVGLGSFLIEIPFSVYHTFVVEQCFGFNKTTVATFIADIFKSLLITILFGVPLLSLVVLFYQISGEMFWFYALLLLSAFMVLSSTFYTTLILPLFNKLAPLEEGELRSAIESYSRKTGFETKNILVMDGSRRSTKANAFFSGMGKRKNIVLFDTLIKDLEVEEVVAVLAHEVGHYKKRHILWGILSGILQAGIMLHVLGLVVNHPLMAHAVGVEHPSFYVGLVVFGILFTPISLIVGLLMNYLSRRNEYAADGYAGATHSAEYLCTALKKISAHALSNPTPHPLYVFFNYSHPPLLLRLKALKRFFDN